MTEIWKDVKGFEGHYQVSDMGRVKSLERVVKGRWGEQLLKGRILSAHPNLGGYMQVCLSLNGNSKTCRVHRLVAESHIPNPENLPEVNHLDEIKSNNRADNLEWCTRSENQLHGTLPKRMSLNAIKNKGLKKANKKRKRSVKSICMITNKVKHYEYMGLARKEGFNVGCITNACTGRSKSHKGYYWEYT